MYQIDVQDLRDNYLVTTLLFTVAYQLAFFTVAYVKKFDKVTDFAGGTNFIILSIVSFLLNKNPTVRSAIGTLCIIVWGVRISGFLLYRILKTEEDRRFNDFRDDFFKFLGFWIFQMVWVWTVSLPITVLNQESSYAPDPPFGNLYDIIGLSFFIIGLGIETVSDFDKFAFSNSNPKPLELLKTGFWKYSRHPNYFGEILLWFGLYIFALPVTKQTGIFTLASPLFTSFLLLFLSGIPLSEPPKEEKFIKSGQQNQYEEYRNSTSPLIPLPNEVYRSINPLIKKVFLFEFPLYRYNPEKGKQS